VLGWCSGIHNSNLYRIASLPCRGKSGGAGRLTSP